MELFSHLVLFTCKCITFVLHLRIDINNEESMEYYKCKMSLAFNDGGVQFDIFKRIVMERFYSSTIDFSNWKLNTDVNNLPVICHNDEEVVNCGSIKTTADLWLWVNQCAGSVFFN